MASMVIANEQANWGSSRRKVRQAIDFLHKQGFPFSWSATEHPGHARELAAAAAAQKIDTVIVIGGDGTVNEAVNGLLTSGQSPLPRLGIVPSGSSNDFSRSLEIPQHLRGACQAILEGRAREVDVGQAGPHCFCTASCLGYFAQVAARSLEMRRLRGSLRYVIPALDVIRNMAGGWEMSVRADGKLFHGVYAVLLVGNASRFGGLTMLPGARLDDGVLDCLLIEMTSRWEALHLIPLVYGKALEHHKKVTRFHATFLSVTLKTPSPICNDGEMDSSPVQSIAYSVLPRKLQVLC
jgi:diacylglycerol kinase (ATP)